jgi:hypothetical protein
VNFREQLKRELKSKTIYNYAVAEFEELYKIAVKIATAKSDLKFPVKCPYTFEQILDENWLPEIEK